MASLFDGIIYNLNHKSVLKFYCYTQEMIDKIITNRRIRNFIYKNGDSYICSNNSRLVMEVEPSNFNLPPFNSLYLMKQETHFENVDHDNLSISRNNNANL